MYNPYGYTVSSYYASAPRCCTFYGPFGRIGSTIYNGRTMVMSRPTPTIADSSVRFIDFVMYQYGNWGPSSLYHGGVTIGTTATQPLANYTSSSWGNMEWHNAESTGDYTAYNVNYTGFPWDMSNYSSGNNAWRWTTTVPHDLYGGDVGTTSDEFIAFCTYRSAYSSTYRPYMMWDDVMICIY